MPLASADNEGDVGGVEDEELPARSATFRCLILCSNLDSSSNHRELTSVLPLPPHSLRCIRSYYWNWFSPDARQEQRFSGPPRPPGWTYLPLLSKWASGLSARIWAVGPVSWSQLRLVKIESVYFGSERMHPLFYLYLPNHHSYVMSYFWRSVLYWHFATVVLLDMFPVLHYICSVWHLDHQLEETPLSFH